MSESSDFLIIGSNPLFGVDHFLADRARERAVSLDNRARLEVVRAAKDAGATAFTFTIEHPTLEFIEFLRDNETVSDLGLYPLVPDAETIPRLLTQGTVGMVAELISGLSWSRKASALAKGGWAVLTGNPYAALATYLDAEVQRLVRAAGSVRNIRTILLHEVFTDAIVALGAKEAFMAYFRQIKERYNVIPGFQTRNYSRLVAFQRSCGVADRDVIIMAPFNPVGFQMTPERADCEKMMESLSGPNVIAISILGSGRVQLEDAVRYLAKRTGLRSVAVGVSRTIHARTTFQALQRLQPNKSPIE